MHSTACVRLSASGPKCALCDAESKWFCVYCGSNCYCDLHACKHIVHEYPEEFQKAERAMTREEYDLHLFQGIDPITGERNVTPKEIEQRKEREESRSLRIFLIFGLPIGLVCATAIGLSTGMNDAGFLCCWAVIALLASALISSIGTKNNS